MPGDVTHLLCCRDLARGSTLCADLCLWLWCIQGTGEVSSANYEARAYGVRASMFMGEAKRRCPHLLVLPYEVGYLR